MMFSVFCPTHDARVLMTRHNAISFWNGPDGSVIRWKCGCGHEGFLDHTGSHADPTNVDCPGRADDSEFDASTIGTSLPAPATHANQVQTTH